MTIGTTSVAVVDPEALGQVLQRLCDRMAVLQTELSALAIVFGVTITTVDRSGQRVTLTQALLKSCENAKMGDVEPDVLMTLRRALEIGSEPTPPDEGERKAA
jgi:hypothetical protein